MPSPAVSPVREAALLPIVGLLGAILSVQVGAAFAKSLFPILGPEGTTMLRLLIGALMLAAVLRPWKLLPNRKGLPCGALTGFLFLRESLSTLRCVGIAAVIADVRNCAGNGSIPGKVRSGFRSAIAPYEESARRHRITSCG